MLPYWKKVVSEWEHVPDQMMTLCLIQHGMLVLEAAVDVMRAPTLRQVSSNICLSLTLFCCIKLRINSSLIFIESTVSIGNDSCLGFSVCEDLSGNVTIGNESCYGLKACSNSSDFSTIKIDSHSCVGARSCMSMSGDSVVSNSSCVDPQACRYMNNGEPLVHGAPGDSLMIL